MGFEVQRMDGDGLVEIDEGIIALGQERGDVVADSFHGGIVDDADGALFTAFVEQAVLCGFFAKEHVSVFGGLPVQSSFYTIGSCIGDFHNLHGHAPCFAGDDGSLVARKSGKVNIVITILHPCQLPDVDHPHRVHVGGAGVADMCVMGPHDGFGCLAVKAYEPIEGFHHMPVADVPAVLVEADHIPIIFLGVDGDQRVLFGIKCRLGIAVEVLGFHSDSPQHGHDFLATVILPEGMPGIGLFVLLEWFEALYGMEDGPGRFLVFLTQVVDHGLHRVPQTVYVEAVKSRFFVLAQRSIVFPEPFREGGDLPISPHPGRPSVKCPEDWGNVVACVLISFDISVYLVAIGPVAFDGDEAEVFFEDKFF